MKITLTLYTIFSVLVIGNCDSSTVDYYMNLIKEEIARSTTYPLPQDSSAFKPASSGSSEYGTFDYIIVGAGSAGAVVASRLSKERANQVLLLETGGHETNFSDIPAMFRHLWKSDFNWNYNSTPQTTVCLGMPNRECVYHRGKGLGGTSIINALMYVRGNKRDYDNWADQGNPGWSYEDVLPFFKKSENSQIGGDEGYHGKGGYLNVECRKFNSPQFDAFIEANLELGRKVIDYNGAEQLGVSRTQHNTINGRRDSTGKAFLLPAMDRPNLKILTHSLVTKILVNSTTKEAYGVLFSRHGKLLEAKARHEIIISAGSISSPQLLMLSGIGPKGLLTRYGIPVIHPLSVGENLQDHPHFVLQFETNYTEPVKNLKQYVEEYLDESGPLTIPGHSQGLGFFQTNLSNIPGYPDIELIFVPSNYDRTFFSEYSSSPDNNYNNLYTETDPGRIFSIFVQLLHPKSRGTLKLKSKSPYDYPLIDLKLLSDPEGEDIETMYQGIQLALEIVITKAFRKLNATLVNATLPACQHHEYLSKEFWYCQLRQLTSSIFHASGTCKMGPDPLKGAVVNHELKVHGMKKLRIADASIIPDVTSGHTNAPAVMIGEKVSNMIKNEN